MSYARSKRTYLLFIALSGFTAAAVAADNSTVSAPAPASADHAVDVLNCKDLDWMRNCNDINTQAKQNPGAPLRVLDKSGVEFDFAPGTPTAMINLTLSPTPANAAKFLDWQAAVFRNSAAVGNAIVEAQVARHEISPQVAQAVMDANNKFGTPH